MSPSLNGPPIHVYARTHSCFLRYPTKPWVVASKPAAPISVGTMLRISRFETDTVLGTVQVRAVQWIEKSHIIFRIAGSPAVFPSQYLLAVPLHWAQLDLMTTIRHHAQYLWLPDDIPSIRPVHEFGTPVRSPITQVPQHHHQSRA